MLQIILSDDGRGIDLERLRAKVVERGLTTAAMAAQLSEAELLEFLFLPGFSTKEHVTEVSGRGVGLDVVHNMVRCSRRLWSASTRRPGKGTRFVLQLPITVSVIRALLVEIAGEPYAFPVEPDRSHFHARPQGLARARGKAARDARRPARGLGRGGRRA